MVITTSLSIAMNTKDEPFFKELGLRIAQARKEIDWTQQQLADQLGIAQQTLAHYEVGRLKVPASMLPKLAELLTVSLDELLGQPLPKHSNKRGPAPRWQHQIEAIAQLPKAQQRFVSQMLDTVLSQAGQ